MALMEAARRVDLPGTIENLASFRTLGERLAWARVNKRLTQADVAKRLKKSRATIVQYEQDHIFPPLKVVERISEILQVPPEFIAFGRRGIEGVGAVGEMVPVKEMISRKDGAVATSGHALSRNLLQDFGVKDDKVDVYVLTHDASAFDLRAGDRVIVSTNETEPSRTHDRYLVKSGDGFDVIGIEPSFAAGKGEIMIKTGSGSTLSLKVGNVEIIGAIVGTIRRN